ncbi:MAG: sulfite exporter TauE/SafE family protein [Bacteroidetes bacterium]|nr:sulfite exporter TauE/SafE family protein [Bacteroidota bacterium]
MSFIIVTALIVSGLLVGFINTLAGGGTIISISLFMFLGLPAGVANGTNRIAVILQTLTSSASFKRQKVLDTRKGLMLGIPTAIGSIIGAEIAVDIDEKIFEKAMAIIMLVMLFFIIYKPQQWLKGQQHLIERKTSVLQYFIFFLIGLYGGFIHVGVGYFILAGLVLNAGYDLVKANALKVFIVLLYAPFTLLVFIYNKQINYEYGLIHAIGNIIGAFIASKFAVSWGANFVRWVIIIIILITSAQLFGIFDFKTLFKSFL